MRTLASTARRVRPGYGVSPVNTSYSRLPSAYTSDRPSTAPAIACSGLM